MSFDDDRRQRRHEEQKKAAKDRPHFRGERGPNCTPVVRERIGRELAALAASKGGLLEAEDYVPYIIQSGGKDLRTLQRYREYAEKLIATETLLAERDGDTGPTPADVQRARARLRGRRLLPEPNEFDLKALTAAPNEYEAWLLLRKCKQSVVCQLGMSRSSFYEMLGRLPKAKRVGLRNGSDEMRKHQAHTPRRINRLGQAFSCDEKKLRVWFRVPGTEDFYLDTYSVRFEDEATGCVMSKQLFDHKPTDEEIAALYAVAVRGWSLHVTGRGLLVLQGAPSLLTSDNAVNLTGPKMRQAEGLTGTVHSAIQGGEPEQDGRHERGNEPLDRVFRRVPGYTRPRTARLDKPYVEYEVDELLTFEQLNAMYHQACDSKTVESYPNTDRHAGRTPVQLAYDLWKAGESDLEPVDDEELMPLAMYLGTRAYDRNAATVRLDNQYFHDPKLAEGSHKSFRLYGLPGDPTFLFCADSNDDYVATAIDVNLMPGFMQQLSKKQAVQWEREVDALQIEAERRFQEGSWAARFMSGGDDGDAFDGDLRLDDPEGDGPSGTDGAPRRPRDAAERAGARGAWAKRDGQEITDALMDDLADDEDDEPGRNHQPKPRNGKRPGGPTGRSAGLKPKTGDADDDSTPEPPDEDDDGLGDFMTRNGL